MAPSLTSRSAMKISKIMGVLCLAIFPLQFAAAQPRGIVSECDFCLCSQSSSPLEWSGSGIRYDVRYTDLSRIYANGKLVANNDGEQETYFTNQLTLNYSPSSAYSLTVIAPYSTKSANGADEHITNSGISDVTVLGRYNLFSSANDACPNPSANDACCAPTTHYAAIIGGAKLATGSTSFRNEETGELADADLQLGTGTTDALGGAAYFVSMDAWTFSANALASVPTIGVGANGHKYGNNLNYDVTARYRIVTRSIKSGFWPTTLVGASFRGELRAKEKQDGAQIEDSGGNVLYAAPNLQLFFTRNIAFDASCWIPLRHDLAGTQLGEALKILAGIQAGF